MRLEAIFVTVSLTSTAQLVPRYRSRKQSPSSSTPTPLPLHPPPPAFLTSQTILPSNTSPFFKIPPVLHPPSCASRFTSMLGPSRSLFHPFASGFNDPTFLRQPSNLDGRGGLFGPFGRLNPQGLDDMDFDPPPSSTSRSSTISSSPH